MHQKHLLHHLAATRNERLYLQTVEIKSDRGQECRFGLEPGQGSAFQDRFLLELDRPRY
jgi:hypothetical protein